MVAPTIEWVRAGVGFTPPAAASFRRMEAQLGRRLDVNSTYRDYNTQLSWYRAWQAWASGRGPKPNHGYAAHPDQSDHCKGIALDTDDSIPQDALFDAHGWVRTDPNESWHRVYRVLEDRFYGKPAGGGGNSFEGDDMTPEQARKLDNIYLAIFTGGESLPDGHKSIGQSLADIRGAVSNVPVAVWNDKTVTGSPAPGSAAAVLNQTNAWVGEIRNLPAGEIPDVDVEALAAKLKDALGAAVADELARRLAS